MSEIANINLDAYADKKIANLFQRVPGKRRPLFNIASQETIAAVDAKLQQEQHHGLIYDLASRIKNGQSIGDIERDLGIRRRIVSSLLNATGIPYLGREAALDRKISDPAFQAQRVATIRTLYEDEDFRTRTSDKIKTALARPETKARISASSVAHWEDDGYRTRTTAAIGKGVRAKHKEPIFAADAAQRGRTTLARLRTDPNFLIANKAGRKKAFENPEYRKRVIETLKPFIKLNSIDGYRSDIDMHALSTWEANLARVFKLLNRDFIPHYELELTVDPEYQALFGGTTTIFDVDFLSVNKRGQMVGYEIMAHPNKDPKGWAKFQMAQTQFGDQLRLIPVTRRFYNRLQRVYQTAVNADPRLAGWETRSDNLKTNPDKYGRPQVKVT